MKRRFDPDDPELMDRPQPLSPALDRDLANLRGLNRWFGAWRILRHVLTPHFRPGHTLRIVDLATGSGDLPRVIVDLAREAGARVEITAVEANPGTLEAARLYCQDTPEIRIVQGDIRTWMPDISQPPPDWVLCSLALHHFTSEDAVTILRRMRSMAVQGALLADLERAWWAVGGVYAASIFYREPMTVEDMRRSAVAAFSRDELAGLADAAGWPVLRHHARFFYGRQAVWYENAVPAAVVPDDSGPEFLPAPA